MNNPLNVVDPSGLCCDSNDVNDVNDSNDLGCIRYSWSSSLQTDGIGYVGKTTGRKYWEVRYRSLGSCIGDMLTPICGSIWSALGMGGAGPFGIFCPSVGIGGGLWAVWCAGEVTGAYIKCTSAAENHPELRDFSSLHSATPSSERQVAGPVMIAERESIGLKVGL